MIDLRKPLEGAPGLLLLAALILFGATIGVSLALVFSWVEMKASTGALLSTGVLGVLGGVIATRMVSKFGKRSGEARKFSRSALFRFGHRTIDALNYSSPTLTALATTALVVVAFFQWEILGNTDRSIELQLSAIRNDQRPVLHMANTTQPYFEIAEGSEKGTVWWNTDIVNVGKGVALNFVAQRKVKVSGSPRVWGDNDKSSPMVAIVPGGSLFTTAFVKDAFTREEFEALLEINYAFSVRLEIEYFDVYGARYSDTFCERRLASGAWQVGEPRTCE